MGRQSRYWLWLAFLLKLGFSAAAPANADEASLIARKVPVGDRELYLVCACSARPGDPSVILLSGYHNSSDPWTESDALSLLPEASGPPVLQGLARDHLVCAYDRPGTLRYVTGFPLTARSTAVAQPRTVRELATELHALLMASGSETIRPCGPFARRLDRSRLRTELSGRCAGPRFRQFLQSELCGNGWEVFGRSMAAS